MLPRASDARPYILLKLKYAFCKNYEYYDHYKVVLYKYFTPKIATPRTTSTTPVARLRVAGSALLANLAAMRAHSRVLSTQQTRQNRSGARRWQSG